jgi:hypothetical protein
VRAGKTVPFAKQVFNIEQKFAQGFDPGRVMAAVREDAEALTDKRLRSEERLRVEWTNGGTTFHRIKSPDLSLRAFIASIEAEIGDWPVKISGHSEGRLMYRGTGAMSDLPLDLVTVGTRSNTRLGAHVLRTWLPESAATKTAPPYPPEIQALRNLLPLLGWTKIEVVLNPGEEYWRHPLQSNGILVMDPAWFDAINTAPFLQSVFKLLSETR